MSELEPRGGGNEVPDRRTAEMIWVTVSRLATASSRIAESSARRCLLANTPVALTTAPTASKIRSGRPVAKAAAPVGEPREIEARVV